MKKAVILIAALLLLNGCMQKNEDKHVTIPPSALTTTTPIIKNDSIVLSSPTPAGTEPSASPTLLNNYREADTHLTLNEAQSLRITSLSEIDESYVSRYTPEIMELEELLSLTIVSVSPWQHSGIIMCGFNDNDQYQIWGAASRGSELLKLYEASADLPVISCITGFSRYSAGYAWVEQDGNHWQIMMRSDSEEIISVDSGVLENGALVIPRIAFCYPNQADMGLLYITGIREGATEKWHLNILRLESDMHTQIEIRYPCVAEKQILLLGDTRIAVSLERRESGFYANVIDISSQNDDIVFTFSIDSPTVPVSIYYYPSPPTPVTYTSPLIWMDELGGTYAYRPDTGILYELPLSIKQITPAREQAIVVSSDGKSALLCFSNYHESEDGLVTLLEIYRSEEAETIDSVLFCGDGTLYMTLSRDGSGTRLVSISIPHFTE